MSVLQKPVNVKSLLRRLAISEETMVSDAVDQSILFSKAARYRVQTLHSKNEAEAQLDLMKAQIAIRIHEREEKITETKVKYLFTKNRKYQEALSKYNQAMEEEVFAKLLCEAFDMRLWCLKIVAETSGMERAVEKKMKEQQERLVNQDRRIKEKYAD